jgi:choline dehydrogenase-like flavoprotein
LKVEDWILSEELDLPGLEADEVGGHHHMCSTRMAATPREGVVDSNQKVFGIDNLYIAGSSVFSTAGHANPTLTIVQMSLRLAGHLETSSG